MNMSTKKEISGVSTSTKIVTEMNSTCIEIAGETPSAELVEGIIIEKSSMENTMKPDNSKQCPCEICFPQVPHLPNEFESKEEYIDFGVPLYEASITGDWETAKIILDKRPDLIRIAITDSWKTALHVAVTAEETMRTLRFVKNLVNMMTIEDLELRNGSHNTALSLASAAGNTKMAMIMVEKNPNLLYIRGTDKVLPLHLSVSFGKYSLVKYFYNNSQKMTGRHWTDHDRKLLLSRCVDCDFFDLALQIVIDRPELAETDFIIGFLARKPAGINRVEMNFFSRIIDPIFRFICMKVRPAAEEDTDALKLLKILWKHVIRTMTFNEVVNFLRGPATKQDDGRDRYNSRILFVAAEMGNTRFIVEILRTFPDFVLHRNDDGLTIFHIAVIHRHQGIYNLLYEIGSVKDDICRYSDEMGNNMLHLVGKSSKEMTAKTSGASLLMQRELLWFKEVEKMVPPLTREQKNKDGQTPYEVFYKESEDLVSKGLNWMKDCMVVATLIVTVAFAVAFTVPGGYHQETGLPVFINGTSFLVFVIADAVSLFSSTTSLLVFLTVLTSRHGQLDFMYSLPRKLMIGLVTLFISVAAMMVTFSASFFVLYHEGLTWVPILIATFATVPVVVFAVLQFPLLVDMFRSMYDSRYLFNPRKRILYNTNQRLRSNYSRCSWCPYTSFITRLLFGRC